VWLLRWTVIVLLAFVHGGAEAAEKYPASQIRIVAPFPAGGAVDLLAREIAEGMRERFAIPVIVENRSGASGIVGSEFVARSPPDGSTLLVVATHHVINPGLFKSIPYDTRRDFTPIAMIASSTPALAVNPAVPVRTVQDFIALAKSDPGAVTYASAGVGGANHLAGELFKAMAAVEMTHIPFQGAAPAMTAVLGGHVSAIFNSLPTVWPYVENGQLRVLGVTAVKRVESIPDVPTIGESGVPGFEVLAWFGLYAPANMPPATLSILQQAMREILASPRIGDSFRRLGVDTGSMTGDVFAKYVDAEIAKWGEVVSRAHIRPQ